MPPWRCSNRLYQRHGGDVRRLLATDRLDRRTPQVAALVIPDVDRLARWVADGVVRPWGELVLAAVSGRV